MRTYAIGDIHGQLGKLRTLHALIEADRARHHDRRAPVVHVGDLVDRGPDSRGVIDCLIAGQAGGQPWIVLKGNHDRMFREFLRDPGYHDPGLRPDLDWLDPRLGGADTLAAYGVGRVAQRPAAEVHAEARAAVPRAHLAFLDALPTYYLRGDCLFVHAGIRPGIDLAAQTEDDLLWIRKPFVDDTRDHGVLVVHGHTPVDRVTHHGNRLNLDTGAGYGRDLSAVVIEGAKVFQLTARGRVAVKPTVMATARRLVAPRPTGRTSAAT